MGPPQGAPRLHVQPQMIMQPQMFEQQKKLAEKHQKQNEELTKKKNFETQQRKLQAFKGKSGAKSNPLNELFGKKDGKSDVSGLIGSLGSSSSQKSVAKTSICKFLSLMQSLLCSMHVLNWFSMIPIYDRQNSSVMFVYNKQGYSQYAGNSRHLPQSFFFQGQF